MNALNLANDQKLLNEMIDRQFNFQNKVRLRMARILGAAFAIHAQLMEDRDAVNFSLDDPLRQTLKALQAYLYAAFGIVENGIRGALLNIKALT